MNRETSTTLRALIIEDSEVDTLLLLEQLAAGGYAVESERIETADALKAALGRRHWDIIFSDHNMPHFSSTEALAIVRATGADLPFIIVSGSIGEDIAVAAMRAGAQDYVMKGNPARLVAAVDRELKDADERRAHREAERALLAQHEEFRIARQIQQQLFPAAMPNLPGFDIAGASRPATATGGDYFDFIPTPQGRLLLALGDATGHGLGPALLMADVRAYLRALATSGHSFAEILTRARRLLMEDMTEEHFITLFFAELDPVSRQLSFFNAGHPPAYLLNAAGQLKSALTATMPALGMDRNEQQLAVQTVTLAKGDLLVIISDGILEASSASGEEFGEERIAALLRDARTQTATEILQRLLDAAHQFESPSATQDDMTAIVVRVMA